MFPCCFAADLLAVFRIRINLSQWIRIQAGQNYPQLKEKIKNFMFDELFFGLESFPGAWTSVIGGLRRDIWRFWSKIKCCHENFCLDPDYQQNTWTWIRIQWIRIRNTVFLSCFHAAFSKVTVTSVVDFWICYFFTNPDTVPEYHFSYLETLVKNSIKFTEEFVYGIY